MRAVAQVLALWVHNSQLIAGLRDRVRELDRQALQLSALTRISRRVAATLDEREAHRVIVAEARALVRADAATLVVPDGTGGVTVAAHDGAEPEDGALGSIRAAIAGAGGGVREGRRALVPLPASDGAAEGGDGVIVVRRTRGPAFDEDDLERLRGLADQASVALANARLLSDLRSEQETRRTLAAAIVLAQEHERRRVAEGLHDGPVQELVGVGLMLDALSSQLEGDAPEAAVERRPRRRGSPGGRPRPAAGDRRPPPHVARGARLRRGHAVAGRAAANGAVCRWISTSRRADTLSETHRTVAFRIVQEAVANVLNHADPTRVSITAQPRGGDVVVEVRDDGRGFDPALPRPGVAEGHLGIAAIEERAALAGGALTIESAEGRGTTLRLVLPAED